MKPNLSLLLVTLLTPLAFVGCASNHPGGNGSGGTKPCKTPVHTPPKGSAERTGILSAARPSIEKLVAPRKVVLVVTYLKVHCGWAWLAVNPQSADGTQHFESLAGLFQEKNGKWVLVEWMPSEEGTDTATYLSNLRKKYPKAPADIFPK